VLREIGIAEVDVELCSKLVGTGQHPTLLEVYSKDYLTLATQFLQPNVSATWLLVMVVVGSQVTAEMFGYKNCVASVR